MSSKIKINSAMVGYEGEIKLSVLKGKKTVKSKVIHNTGTWRLFECIAQSLAGKYNASNSSRPKYIRLYNGAAPSTVLESTWFDEEFYTRIQEDSSHRSDYLVYSTSPLVYYNDHRIMGEPSSADKAAVIFKFIIPYVKIFGEDTNLFVLYASSSGEVDRPVAYFALTKKNEEGQTLWGAISDLTSDLKEYNVSIEWTMTIQNKQ